MRISASVLCSERQNHIWPKLADWCAQRGYWLTDKKSELGNGHLLLLISCTEIVEREVRAKFDKTLVIHESALPAGRGWSPFAWQILEGKNEIVVSLLEAEDKVDSGAIWHQETLRFEGHELSPEINEVRDAARIRLAEWAIEHLGDAEPRAQVGEATYYARRTPPDSRLEPHRTIAEQFDLLRICEPRFPAFFDYRGHRYEVSLRKAA